jgi:hypothetical protein
MDIARQEVADGLSGVVAEIDEATELAQAADTMLVRWPQAMRLMLGKRHDVVVGGGGLEKVHLVHIRLDVFAWV